MLTELSSAIALHQALSRLEAVVTTATAAFDTGGQWALDGARTPAAWLGGHRRRDARGPPAPAAPSNSATAHASTPSATNPPTTAKPTKSQPWSHRGPTLQHNGQLACGFHNRLRARSP